MDDKSTDEVNFLEGSLILLGGNQADYTDTEILDISHNVSVCTKPPDLPAEYYKGSIGAYFDGKLILCGGNIAQNQCHKYTFENQYWSRASYSMIEVRIKAAGAMLKNGTWIIIGGENSHEKYLFSTEVLKNELFLASFQWPESVSGHCVANLNSSDIFVVGGENNFGNLGSAYFLNVYSLRWIPVEESMKHPRSGHVCGFISDSKKALHAVIAGGFELLEVEILDLKTVRWESGPNLPHEMNWAANTFQKGSMVILGGEHIGYCSKSHLCYSSDAIFKLNLERWSWDVQQQTLSLPRSKMVAIEVPNSLELCQQICENCPGKDMQSIYKLRCMCTQVI